LVAGVCNAPNVSRCDSGCVGGSQRSCVFGGHNALGVRPLGIHQRETDASADGALNFFSGGEVKGSQAFITHTSPVAINGVMDVDYRADVP